ncbi:MAG: hypothetical protein Q8Q09_22260 [Deltaproteobacteria bacterium]|nr:hypothetical protein [Deltaproteobacteria bacterium]
MKHSDPDSVLLRAAARTSPTVGVTAPELARYLRVSVASATKLLDRAAREGTVEIDLSATTELRNVVYRADPAILAAEAPDGPLACVASSPRSRSSARSALAHPATLCVVLVFATVGVWLLALNAWRYEDRRSIEARAVAHPAFARSRELNGPCAASAAPAAERALAFVRQERLTLEIATLRERIERRESLESLCAQDWASPDGRCYVSGRLVSRATFADELDQLRADLRQRQSAQDVLVERSSQ